MMGERMVLGVIITKVFRTRYPVNSQLTLTNSVINQNCFVSYSDSHGVVDLHKCGYLGPSHHNKCYTDGYDLLGIDEHNAILNLCNQCHDISHYFTNNMDNLIDSWDKGGCKFGISWSFTKEVYSTESAS